MTTLAPYLSFRGDAREAMEFYRSVLGGDLLSNTFREFQMPGIDESELDLVMHSQLTTPGGLVLQGSDAPSSMRGEPKGSDITISLFGDDEAELRGYWDGLSEGASIGVPLEKAPWGDFYGQLTDRYGIGWMVNIAGESAGGDPS